MGGGLGNGASLGVGGGGGEGVLGGRKGVIGEIVEMRR